MQQGLKTVHGETGVLRHVHFNDHNYHKAFLVMEHEGEYLVGTLLFNDGSLRHQILEFLQQHIGCSIKELGNLEIL
jgi:hypothetical protein